MKAFRIKYNDGSFEIVIAKSSLDVIKKHDLCAKQHINTRLEELSGEQEAIAFSNVS